MNTVKSWVGRVSATLRWGGPMALALAVGALAPARAAEVVVGQVAPLSGVLASTGAQMVLGGKIYFDWVNAQGGVHGASIRQAVADDGYKVADTVTRTRELLAKPEVVALYGFAGTANITQLLADGVLEQGGAALVAPYTGGESLRNPFNPWIFHVRAGYADETEHMVQQLTTLGMNRVAVMYQDDGFGKAGLKNAHGLGISQVVPYPYRPQLPVVREYQTLLKKYAPDAEVNYTSFEQFLGAKVLVEALRRAGPAPTRAKVVKALESLQSYDLGGITLGYSPTNRIGSRYVEVTVIGSNGRLMK